MSAMQLVPFAVHFQIANLYSLATPPLWERSSERTVLYFIWNSSSICSSHYELADGRAPICTNDGNEL